MNILVLKEIEEARQFLDERYVQYLTRLNAARNASDHYFTQLAKLLNGGANSLEEELPTALVENMLTTPNRQNYTNEENMITTPSIASPPVNRATRRYDQFFDGVIEGTADSWQNCTASERRANARRRLTQESIPEEKRNRSPPVDCSKPCQVLVAFKRERVLQFESPTYVAPGEYVVVGGDRGEDIGLVTHSWTAGECDGNGEKKCGEGVGKVLRVASPLEVSQLQSVQTELEERAVEVAQKKVEEHGLPMCIVDAEYQFDRKKLTFYYRSQHRLDFRTLVRDLYKTFRARIWMEPDTNP